MFLLFWEVSPALHLVDSQNLGNLLQIGSKEVEESWVWVWWQRGVGAGERSWRKKKE